METKAPLALAPRMRSFAFSALLWAALGAVVRRLLPRNRTRPQAPQLPPHVVAERITGGVSSRPRLPIVLAHGWVGFGGLAKRALSGRYFRGVRECLEALGCEVHVVRVPPTASVEVRAKEFARQIEALGHSRVNVVAHSMGGLDVRHAISTLGLADKIASLVTIGTPHRGTPIANLLDHGAFRLVGGGIHDLTTDGAAAFNERVPDADGVFYGSIVGATTHVQRFLEPGYDYLRRLSGRNDGIVPASSQAWGHSLGEVDADHLAQVGWSRHFDVRNLYAALVAQVATAGC